MLHFKTWSLLVNAVIFFRELLPNCTKMPNRPDSPNKRLFISRSQWGGTPRLFSTLKYHPGLLENDCHKTWWFMNVSHFFTRSFSVSSCGSSIRNIFAFLPVVLVLLKQTVHMHSLVAVWRSSGAIIRKNFLRIYLSTIMSLFYFNSEGLSLVQRGSPHTYSDAVCYRQWPTFRLGHSPSPHTQTVDPVAMHPYAAPVCGITIFSLVIHVITIHLLTSVGWEAELTDP